MIEITYRHHGQRPRRTETIRQDANSASTLPPSFAVEGVRYERGEFTLLVEPPNDNISQNAIDAIAVAFEDNWGGSVEFVESKIV